MRDAAGEKLARVVSIGQNAIWVALEGEDELVLAAMSKGRERLRLAPGDLVSARPLEDGRVLVERREPRTFALTRRTGGGRTKTMAANVDGIGIVAALAEPPFHAAMVDELLAFAQLHEIGAMLVLTKPDKAAPGHGERIAALYSGLGYQTLVLNPKSGEGVGDLERLLSGRHTLLIGQSGVGKSTIFRALGGSGRVGEVSRFGRGKQTTSSGRLHRFPEGFVIDSPGVSDFELHGLEPGELAAGFIEFTPLVARCRFTDCTHRTEPGCAVRDAVAAGTIAASRYESYRAIEAREASG